MSTTATSIQPSLEGVVSSIDRPLRAWSLIVTIFGDAIAPRGGSVWLGNLLEIMATIGIDAGVVRTALSRLVTDGWVERERVGRNSFYRLTPRAQTLSETAAIRIYSPPHHIPFAGWTIAVLPDANAMSSQFDARSELRATAVRSGAGMLSASTMIWPSATTHAALTEETRALGVVHFSVAPKSQSADREILALAWPVEDLRRLQNPLSATLDAIATSISGKRAGAIPNLYALALRTVLIHEWRRIILRVPDLPTELLDDDWPTPIIHRQVSDLYRRLSPGAELWLDQNGRDSRGSLPTVATAFAQRFQTATQDAAPPPLRE